MLRQIFLLFVCLLLISLSHLSESAIAVKPASEGQFSALAAHPHIERIAAKIHPIGSIANQEVRDYIVVEFEKLGLEVSLEKGYSTQIRGKTQGLIAYTENIIAIRKGKGGAKKVYVAGHYDSVFEGPGAADDGYSVASMLETARLLQNESLKNDIVFLVTDGEEGGLNGARFHQQHNSMKDVGVLLNYEARGNAGPGIAFEWSDDNAWLVREMSRVAVRPIANSMSYEVYKRMWNSTDVTEFKKRGMPFINHAFIDGFPYYHNPADNAENISKESVQHTGENMYRMVRHFANYDFGEVERGNAVFFNLYGQLIRYPAVLDVGLMALLILLIGWYLLILVKNKKTTVTQIGITILLQIVIIAIAMLFVYALAYFITAVYPEYSLFYAYQYYNYKWYLFAALGLSVLLTYGLGSELMDRFGRDAFAGGLLFLLGLLAVGLHIGMPTGAYVILIPTLFYGIFLNVFRGIRSESKVGETFTGIVVFAVFAGIWTFVTHNLFLAFSLDLLIGPVLISSLLTFVMMSLFSEFGEKKNALLGAVGTIVFLLSIIIAHFQRTPTTQAPLPSQLFYTYAQGAEQGFWATRDEHLNGGHAPLQSTAIQDALPSPLPFARWYRAANFTPTALMPKLRKDTMANGSLVYNIVQPKRALRNVLTIPEVADLDSLVINGHTAKVFEKGQQGRFDLLLLGVGLDSMQVQLAKPKGDGTTLFRLSTRFDGLPEAVELPEGIARRGGYTEVIRSNER